MTKGKTAHVNLTQREYANIGWIRNLGDEAYITERREGLAARLDYYNRALDNVPKWVTSKTCTRAKAMRRLAEKRLRYQEAEKEG